MKGIIDMDMIVKFNDESFWEWGDWEEPYIKAVFAHANIQVAEIYAADVEDDEEMTLCVKELDPASGKHISKQYALRYFEETVTVGYLMFAHFLWVVDGCNMTLIDQGIYQMHRRNDGTYSCLCIAEET